MIARLAVWVVLLAGCERCASREPAWEAKHDEALPGRPVPAGSLRDEAIYVQLAVILPEKRAEDLTEVASQQAVFGMPGVRQVPAIEKGQPLPYLLIEAPARAHYQLPDLESMKYANKDVPESEWKRIADAEQVVVLTAALGAKNADAQHRELLALIGKLAELWQGFPWDNETREVYSRQAWARDRSSWKGGPPHVAKHMTMHAYRDSDLLRIVTLGMSKLGYPDIVANDVPSTMSDSMSSLINLAAQTMVERGALDKVSVLELSIDALANADAKAAQSADLLDNAERRVEMPIAFVEPEEGDADNRLIELRFERSPDEALQVAQGRALGKLYGHSDEMHLVDHDASELQAASKRARAELMELKKKLENGQPGVNEHVSVKAPFRTTSGGNEWMWVELVRWEGTTIHGVLDNDPFEVPELKAGAKVSVREDDVFDYIHVRADGSRAGNLTGPIIERLSQGHEQK